MKLLFAIFAVGVFAEAQLISRETRAGASNAVTFPVIGVIDFYGAGKIPLDRVRRALAVKEGDPLPSSKADTEERINAVQPVVESHLEAVCCDAGKVILYVGLEERGAPRLDVREEPEGEVKLPEAMFAAYQDYMEAAAKAPAGIGQDLTRGYALSADASVRQMQQRFPELVKVNIKEIREVLRSAFDEEQRTASAMLVAYNPSKNDAENDLQFALRDSAPAVRAIAADGLTALIVYSQLNPRQNAPGRDRTLSDQVDVQPTWFIEMLNSLSWSDRSHALKALDLMTGEGIPVRVGVLDQLRERSLASVIEMTRWKTPQHALPAFLLTGRIAGLSEQQIQNAWTKGDRESVIKAAQSKKK